MRKLSTFSSGATDQNNYYYYYCCSYYYYCCSYYYYYYYSYYYNSCYYYYYYYYYYYCSYTNNDKVIFKMTLDSEWSFNLLSNRLVNCVQHMFVKYVICVWSVSSRVAYVFLPNVIARWPLDASPKRKKPRVPSWDPVVAALITQIISKVTDVIINLYWIKQDMNTRPSAWSFSNFLMHKNRFYKLRNCDGRYTSPVLYPSLCWHQNRQHFSSLNSFHHQQKHRNSVLRSLIRERLAPSSWTIRTSFIHFE